jgi:glutamate:Na+ symporter, ESS family
MSEAIVPTFEMAGRQIVVLSILVLYLGVFITRRVSFLQKHNIPPSVTGGLICSIVVALLAGLHILQMTFDLELRNLLLLFFFSTIGLNAKLKSLAAGGKALVLLVVICAVYLVIQNVIGVVLAVISGNPPAFGLFGGSVSLAGGHGTAIAWGAVATEEGIEGAAEFGIACATFGLILGGLLGGPIAGWLVSRGKLCPRKEAETRSEALPPPTTKATKYHVSVEDVLNTVLALGLCLALGDAVNRYMFAYQIRLPGFLTAMMVGVVITNVADLFKTELKHDAIDIIGGVSLQLFLVMSLMSMDLLSLADSVGLLVAVITIQALAITFFATQVVFRAMGSDYDAAVITGGFVGLGLGATPVAIASMDAVSSKHGSSAKALVVVPLVGAFFIDLINAGVIGVFLRLPIFH